MCLFSKADERPKTLLLMANFSKFEIEKQELTGGSNTMGIEELLLETATRRGEKKAHAKAYAEKL